MPVPSGEQLSFFFLHLKIKIWARGKTKTRLEAGNNIRGPKQKISTDACQIQGNKVHRVRERERVSENVAVFLVINIISVSVSQGLGNTVFLAIKFLYESDSP